MRGMPMGWALPPPRGAVKGAYTAVRMRGRGADVWRRGGRRASAMRLCGGADGRADARAQRGGPGVRCYGPRAARQGQTQWPTAGRTCSDAGQARRGMSVVAASWCIIVQRDRRRHGGCPRYATNWRAVVVPTTPDKHPPDEKLSRLKKRQRLAGGWASSEARSLEGK